METLTHVIAIGGQSWGKGETAFEAVNNWAKNFGSMRYDSITINMRAVSDKAYIDEMGTLYAKRMEKLPDLVITKKQHEEIWGGVDVLNELLYPISDALDELPESEIDF